MSENGREPLYVVRRSQIHGRGVFAACRIRKGTRIVEYRGERIDNDEADRRYDDSRMKRHLFGVADNCMTTRFMTQYTRKP